MGRTARRPARCTGDQKGQKKVRTNSFVADGFLRRQFLPLYRPGTDVPGQRGAEQGFFASLDRLRTDSGKPLATYRNKPYPYNILLSYWQLQRQYPQQPDVSLYVLSKDDGSVTLATQKVYNTGTTLFFIPVLPLHRLLSDRKRKRCAELLLSVCSYLYHVAGVPYYRDTASALNYYYEVIEEWLKDDLESYEPEELAGNFADLNKAAYVGDVMFRKLFSRVQLERFAERLARFCPTDELEQSCYTVARSCYDLWQAFPQAVIFRNMRASAPVGEDEDGLILAEQYISFVADTEGWVYGQIAEMLNNEFNECAAMEEPTVFDLHDGKPKIDAPTLEFEERIFPLIEQLCTVLNAIP